MSAKILNFVLPFVCLASAFGNQRTPLIFRPLAAQYSTSLDKIILISAIPNTLHIYDGNTSSDEQVALPEIPGTLSVSPDGMFAAVSGTASVFYINLQSASLVRTYPIDTTSIDMSKSSVVLSPTYFYLMPSYEGSIVSVELASGSSSIYSFVYDSGGKYNLAQDAIYGTEDGISPNDIYKYDLSGGSINRYPIAGPYWGTYCISGPLWFSSDWSRIYTGCNTVFRSSSDTTQDMSYFGQFTDLQFVQGLPIPPF